MQHEVLLHPQADAGQGEPCLRLPARRVRHARRDVRAADADADRQGAARPDRPARPAREPVLEAHRRADPRAAGGRRPGRPRPTPGCTSSPTRSRRRAPRSTGSTPTTTRSATSATRWSCASRHSPSDELLAELDERFRHLLARGRFVRSEPLDIERRHDDHLELPRLRFSFAKHKATGLRAADRHPEPRRRADRRRRQRPRPGRRGADAGSGLVALTEQAGRLLDGPSGLDQHLVLRGRAVAPSATACCSRSNESSSSSATIASSRSARSSVRVPAHRRTASATMSTGWRTVTPAAWRCIAHPGLALATTVAPLRCEARRMAASLRSRISPASVGSSAE